MIFSTEKCPLCNGNLELSIIESSQPGKVGFMYSCDTRVVVRNEADTHAVSVSHYENLCYSESEMCFMVIPPFELMHWSSRQTTSVRKVSAHEVKKIIFETSLLDWDYSDPHAVMNRLKGLVIFS